MYIDRLLILFILGAYLLSPAVIRWWGGGELGWYQPYIFWGLLILLSYWATHRSRQERNR